MKEMMEKDITPPKRKCHHKFHPDRSVCSPYALWSQSGSDSRLRQFHPIEKSRHAGTDALALLLYAAFDNTHFCLDSNDCVYQSCHNDFTRNHNNSEITIPRLAKLRNEVCNQPMGIKHALYLLLWECVRMRADHTVGSRKLVWK